MALGKLVGDFFGGIWSKLGLYVGYVAIAFAIALGCAAVWMYKQNGQLNTKVGNLQTTVDARGGTIKQLEEHNKEQDTTIDQLKKLRQTDATVVNGLISDVRKIHATNASTKAKISLLEKRSEEVKAYLNAPVPDALRHVDSVSDHAVPSSSGHDHQE